MALQPLSVGDILMLSQTAWKVGRAFAHGKKSAPSEFAEVEREADGLSEALKLVAEALHGDNSILAMADQDTKNAVTTILESAHTTLSDLESFVQRYQIIKVKQTKGGTVNERSWSAVVMANYKTLKWTTEGGDITALRDMLQVHTNSLNLTLQALQSRSLARLENTVVPMAENISSIYERVNGDLGDKITELHALFMQLASRGSPSRERAIENGPRSISDNSARDSLSDASIALIEDSPAPDMSIYTNRTLRVLEPPVSRRSSAELSPRPLVRSGSTDLSSPTLVITPAGRKSREDSAVEDWSPASLIRDYGSGEGQGDRSFELGTPPSRQPSISNMSLHRDEGNVSLSPSSRRELPAFRRESDTVPNHLKPIGIANNDGEPSSSSSNNSTRAIRSQSYSPKTETDSREPAFPIGQEDTKPVTVSWPSGFGRLKQSQSVYNNNFDNPVPSRRTLSVQTMSQPAKRRPVNSDSDSQSVVSESQPFDRFLFRNSAILCDVRGKVVEYMQPEPDKPRPSFNGDMVEACKGARICVVSRREHDEHGGDMPETSIWCLSDDGEHRMQQTLSAYNETVPFCSYFEREKLSLQWSDGELQLKFHSERWGARPLNQVSTDCVNYYFESQNDADLFQSAVFGRTLIGSFRTTKTTVIHEGLKGVLASEEQFAAIEVLRLWEDDGVAMRGAAGGVMALVHVSSSFGTGWARFWLNSHKQQVRVKEDGLRWVKVRGIDISVIRPRALSVSSRAESTDGSVRASNPGLSLDGRTSKKTAAKRVTGVRIEFKTEEERANFLSVVKRVQMNLLHLPDL